LPVVLCEKREPLRIVVKHTARDVLAGSSIATHFGLPGHRRAEMVAGATSGDRAEPVVQSRLAE
jgi:hypothetical protein